DRIPGGKESAIAARASVHADVHADIRRSGDVIRLGALFFEAEIVMGDIDKAGLRGKGRWLPVLAAGRGRADIAHGFEAGYLRGIQIQLSRFQVDGQGAVDVSEGLSGKDFARGAVHDVHAAVPVRV